MSETTINAKEAVNDIRAGMDDAALMAKYRLSAGGLQSFIRKLADAGVLHASEVQARFGHAEENIVIDYSGLDPGATPAQARSTSKKTDSGEPPMALIISDEGGMVGLIISALGAGFLRTTMCKDPKVTGEVLAKFPCHFVILDVGLTRSNFLDVMSAIRNFDDCMPVLLISDAAHRKDAVQGIQQGAYGVLEKPLEPMLTKSVVSRCAEYRELALLKRDHQQIVDAAIAEQTAETIRTKDFLKGILDSSTLTSIVANDMKQNILFWNTGAENMFGYSATEMVGSKATRVFPIEALTPDESTIHPNVHLEAADGSALTMALAITPLKDEAGNVRGIVGIGLDMVADGLSGTKETAKLLEKMKQAHDASILALARLIESREGKVGSHLARVQEYCRILCVSLAKLGTYGEAMNDRFVDDLVRASVLHDVGKAFLPDSVVLFKDEYSPEQREIMKQHPLAGGRALQEALESVGSDSYLHTAMEIALHHHERWDGTGYPSGLQGPQIPLSARIVALADSYDALTGDRPYRKAFSHQQACTMIIGEKETHFDPRVVDAFEDLADAFPMIRTAFED